MKISAPNDDDIAALAGNLARVADLARSHLDKSLSATEDDLSILQSLLDAGVIQPSDTYDLQSMGVLFGTLVVDALDDVDWAIVEDEYGRDPALRYADTTLLVFPLTMISKRIEDGEVVDVHALFALICAEMMKLETEVARSH